MAKCKGEVFNGLLLEFGIIEGDIEVSGENTTLVGELRDQEEVILEVRVLAFHKLLVNDATRRRVLVAAMLILHKESLGDTLVHNDHSQ